MKDEEENTVKDDTHILENDGAAIQKMLIK